MNLIVLLLIAGIVGFFGSSKWAWGIVALYALLTLLGVRV